MKNSLKKWSACKYSVSTCDEEYCRSGLYESYNCRHLEIVSSGSWPTKQIYEPANWSSIKVAEFYHVWYKVFLYGRASNAPTKKEKEKIEDIIDKTLPCSYCKFYEPRSSKSDV